MKIALISICVILGILFVIIFFFTVNISCFSINGIDSYSLREINGESGETLMIKPWNGNREFGSTIGRVPTNSIQIGVTYDKYNAIKVDDTAILSINNISYILVNKPEMVNSSFPFITFSQSVGLYMKDGSDIPLGDGILSFNYSIDGNKIRKEFKVNSCRKSEFSNPLFFNMNGR